MRLREATCGASRRSGSVRKAVVPCVRRSPASASIRRLRHPRACGRQEGKRLRADSRHKGRPFRPTAFRSGSSSTCRGSPTALHTGELRREGAVESFVTAPRRRSLVRVLLAAPWETRRAAARSPNPRSRGSARRGPLPAVRGASRLRTGFRARIPFCMGSGRHEHVGDGIRRGSGSGRCAPTDPRRPHSAGVFPRSSNAARRPKQRQASGSRASAPIAGEGCTA